jgi:ABC-2 type transport system permease protein
MNKLFNFYKRNFKESLRDPILYVFCLGFPIVMLVIFSVIEKYSAGNTPMFELKSLIPAIITFSYSFVTLALCLMVSKDRQTFFLKRLYSSPMKCRDFVLGYALVGVVIGLVQTLVCISFGFILAITQSTEYIPFTSLLLLIVSQLPMLVINVFLGVLIGCLFSDKSAPGVSSVFISLSGIMGGCWMPLESMGGFETFCRFLPFYPSVYIGRVVTGAKNFFGVTLKKRKLINQF